MAKDYYQILGVSKTASPEEIRKAYHKLAHQHHPDKGGDESKFKEGNEAYQTLSNKDKRAQYDQFGRVFEGGQAPGGAGGWDFGFGQGNPGGFGQQQGFDPADLGDLFGEMFGFGGHTKKQNTFFQTNLRRDNILLFRERKQSLATKVSQLLRKQGMAYREKSYEKLESGSPYMGSQWV